MRSPVYFSVAAGDPFVIAAQNLILFAFLVLGLVGTVGVLRRLPIAYGGYMVAAVALPLSYPVPPQPLTVTSRTSPSRTEAFFCFRRMLRIVYGHG